MPLVLDSRGEPSNNYTVNFSSPLQIAGARNAEIALDNFQLKLLPDQISIVQGQNEFSYATQAPTGANYAELIAAHHCTIPTSVYNIPDLVNDITHLSNYKLVWNTAGPWANEQGAEIICTTIPGTNRLRWTFVGRTPAEQTGPAPAAVQIPQQCTYALDGGGLGLLTRTAADAADGIPDSLLYTLNVFSRGCGQVSTILGQANTYFVMGLMSPEDINTADIAATIGAIHIGVMVLPAGNTYGLPADEYITIDGSGFNETGTERAANAEITMTLGRTIANGVLSDYQIAIDEVTTNTPIHTLPWEGAYGNYVLVCGLISHNDTLTSLTWSQSKVTLDPANLNGFYATYNPAIVEDDNNFIDTKSITDGAVGFIGNQTVRVTLDFFDDETAAVFGFTTAQTTTPNYNTASKVYRITAPEPLDLGYSYPESIKLVTTLPINSYVNGRPTNVLSSIPYTISTDGTTVSYVAPTPRYISLTNINGLYISKIGVRLEDDSGGLIKAQAGTSLSLLLRYDS